LKTEGVFRVSGSKEEITKIKKKFDSGKPVEFTAEDNVHLVAGVLKQFLLEPEESLLTEELYDAFMDAIGTLQSRLL
jgi:hypothetical protein